MLKDHPYNLKQIEKLIRENRKKGKKKNEAETGLYEKIVDTFKGAVVASPELIREIDEVIFDSHERAGTFLKDMHNKSKEAGI